MAAVMETKNQNNPSQKYYGFAPSVGIATMSVSTMPEKKNNKFESIKKLTNRKLSLQL